jgi:hypothetical protein
MNLSLNDYHTQKAFQSFFKVAVLKIFMMELTIISKKIF